MFLEELKKEQEERDQRLKAKQAMLAGASRDYTTDSGLTLRAGTDVNVTAKNPHVTAY